MKVAEGHCHSVRQKRAEPGRLLVGVGAAFLARARLHVDESTSVLQATERTA